MKTQKQTNDKFGGFFEILYLIYIVFYPPFLIASLPDNIPFLAVGSGFRHTLRMWRRKSVICPVCSGKGFSAGRDDDFETSGMASEFGVRIRAPQRWSCLLSVSGSFADSPVADTNQPDRQGESRRQHI
jgi:hypothetical protein